MSDELERTDDASRGPDGARKVIFVCTGNTCRSPLAEAIARDTAQRRGLSVEFGSAGVAAAGGTPASEAAEIVGRRHGLDLSGHRSTPLSAADLREAQLVLVMEEAQALQAWGIDAEAPVRLITEFLPASHPRRGQPVPDPFGGWVELYENTFEVLGAAIEGLMNELEASSQGDAGSRDGPGGDRSG